MAIFYKEIKGLASNSDSGGNNENVFSHIIFKENTPPELEVGSASFGNFIVQGKTNSEQTINTSIKVPKIVKLNESTPLIIEEVNFNGGQVACDKLVVNSAMEATQEKITFSKPLEVYNTLEVKNNYVKAQYFVSTSDKNLKDDIIPLDHNLKDAVLNTPINTFKYKDGIEREEGDEDNRETFVGIVAQDLISNLTPETAELFVFKDAEGNLQLKESKLIYLLWQTIQKQQEQINELAKRVAEVE